jgi:hypothetical protein
MKALFVRAAIVAWRLRPGEQSGVAARRFVRWCNA